MHELAIVVLNYNTKELLDACLDSLRAQADIDFVTCVVDNASSDGSPDWVAQNHRWVHLIRNTQNNGYAAGNNLGLRHFGYPEEGVARYVMLLNPDTLVPTGALRGLVDFADANPDVGVVGPKLLLMDGTLDLACRRSFPTPAVSFYRLIGLSKLFPRSRRFGRYNLTYLDIDEQADVDSVVGACMMVRADAVRQAGLLDEQFFMYGEDLDWCLRIKKCRAADGCPYRVVYYPRVTVRHVKRAASRRSPKAQFEFDRAMWLFYRKHYQPSTFFLVDWLIRLGLALRGGPRLAREVFG
ncbi:MAG: glycosyltransferase family 2 protein [Anaerolineae bacterium]|nr:glycosyltransferase family 2 protein [Thermoflexales bacterium]MDW8408087.1 glycosyltransferase family 2 protein [Anaerolineae bacterium]